MSTNTDADNADSQFKNETHETREECVEAEEWLTQEPTKRVVETHGQYVYYECPVCGREYSYCYNLLGLWSEDDNEYVWKDY